MKKIKEKEIKGIYIVALIVFLAFLFVPLVVLFRQALEGDGGVTLANFGEMLSQKGFGTAVANSMSVSVTSAVAATLLAFLLAYTIHYTNAPRPYKKFIRLAAQLPMLLPTIEALGVDPVHFGVVMAVNLALGLCSPPYGCNLFVGAAVAKIKMESMFKYIVPYFIIGTITLFVITYVPAISLVFLD